MGKRFDEQPPPPVVRLDPRSPVDDYDGQRFFEGLMWALGFSAGGLALVYLLICIFRRFHG